MSKTAVITTRIESEELEALEALAKRLDRSRAWVVSEAINAYITEQTQFLDFVQQGTDDLDNGGGSIMRILFGRSKSDGARGTPPDEAQMGAERA